LIRVLKFKPGETMRSRSRQLSKRTRQLSLCVGGIAVAGLASQLHAQVTGNLATTSVTYGAPLSTQTINTGFGDSTVGDGTSAGGSELDAAYATVSGGNLNVFIAGNFEAGTNANHVDLFIDNGLGNGQNVLSAGASGFLGGLNGSVFSPTFNASYALDGNDYQNTFYLDQYDLVNNKANYLGSIPVGTAGSIGIGNNQNLNGIKVGFNNTNAAGVTGSATGTAASAAAADAVNTGVEYSIPLTALGTLPAGDTIKLLVALNGSGDNYMSNQMLPGLPVGTGNLGALTSPYSGVNAGGFNVSSIPNDWFSVTLPNTLPNGDWLPTGGGSWGSPSSNWSNGVIPGNAGDTATFATATASSTVTLDGARSLGSLNFSDVANSYTLAAGTGGVLTMDNGANAATITDLNGTHTISAPMVLKSTTTTVTIVNHGDVISFSGNIGGTGGLNVVNQGGTSSLQISGTNTWGGGTTVTNGNLQLGSSTALPTGTALTLSAVDLPAGVLDLNGFNANVSSITVLTGPNTVSLGAFAQIINTSATPGTATLTFAGVNANPSAPTAFNITDSSATGGSATALVVASGMLTLGGNNTYGGGTTIDAPATLTLSATGGTPLPVGGNVVNNGALVVNDLITTGNISGTGTTTVNALMSLSAGAFTQGALVNNGSTAVTGAGTVGPISGAGTLTVGGGAAGNILKLATGSGLSTQDGLTIDANSALDIGNNHVIINYGTNADPIATIRGYLVAGFANKAWNGTSTTGGAINSSAANASYGIGYGDGADGIVKGLSSGQILIKYTLYGDLNLDGVVNGTDFGILAAHFGKNAPNWDEGDLNYDGVVNGTDFGLLASNFGKSDSGVAVALPASQWAALDAFAASHGLLADVPEPTTLGLMVLAGAGALARRRRR
jgi:fibronectin-binding autotransporter adhesin